MYKVYKLTCPNGKSYVGCTSLELEARFNGGKGYVHNEALFLDIMKYGWDNFKKEVILETSDKAHAFYSEEWLIFYYGDYNAASGNNNAHKRVPVAQYGHNGTMLAQYPSATQAALILNCNPSDIYRACKEKGLSHGFRWRFLSDEIKSLPAYEPSKRGVNTKSVIQLTKSGEFVAEYPSIKAASECTGINNGTISAVCRGNGKHKYAGGFKWMYK